MATSAGVMDRLSFSLASRQEVRSHYQRADATLFTSMIKHEAFGLVPLEAMASGCLVISTGVGGSGKYCLNEVNCLRIPPGDAGSLAFAVQKLAANPDLRRRLHHRWVAYSDLTLDRQAERIEHWLLTAATMHK